MSKYLNSFSWLSLFKSSKIADKSDPPMMEIIEEPLSREQYARPHPSGSGLQVSGQRCQEIQTVSFLLSSSWRLKSFVETFTHSLHSQILIFKEQLCRMSSYGFLYLILASSKLTVSIWSWFLNLFLTWLSCSKFSCIIVKKGY